MGKAESRVETVLTEGVEALGGTCEKFVTPGKRGPPDRLICWPEKWEGHNGNATLLLCAMEFVETKSVNGVLEPWQERDHARRRAMGFRVSVLWTVDQVEAFLRSRGKKTQ